MLFVVLVMALTALTVVTVSQDNDHYSIANSKGCCSIKVDRINSANYTVQWIDHNSTDSYIELVEIEYPDADFSTPEEHLQWELKWTIAEFKDICFTAAH